MCPHCHADSGLLQQILRKLAHLDKPTVDLFFIGFFRDYPATWWAQWNSLVRKLIIHIRPYSYPSSIFNLLFSHELWTDHGHHLWIVPSKPRYLKKPESAVLNLSSCPTASSPMSFQACTMLWSVCISTQDMFMILHIIVYDDYLPVVPGQAGGGSFHSIKNIHL